MRSPMLLVATGVAATLTLAQAPSADARDRHATRPGVRVGVVSGGPRVVIANPARGYRVELGARQARPARASNVRFLWPPRRWTHSAPWRWTRAERRWERRQQRWQRRHERWHDRGDRRRHGHRHHRRRF